MRMCWHADPACRPPFTYFVESISKLCASQNYSDASCKKANPVIVVTRSSEPLQSTSVFLSEESDRKCLDRLHDHRTTTTKTTTTTSRRQPEKHRTVNGNVHEGIPKFNPDHRTHQDSEQPLISVPTPVVSHYAQKTEGGSVPLTEQGSPASPCTSDSCCDSCAAPYGMILVVVLMTLLLHMRVLWLPMIQYLSLLPTVQFPSQTILYYRVRREVNIAEMLTI